VDPVAFTRKLASLLGFGERVRSRMARIGQRRTGHAMEEFVLPDRTAARGDLPEALIVHDRDDVVVGIDNGRTLAAAWRESHLVQTSGLGHTKILRDDAVVERVAAFIAGEPVAAGKAAPGTTTAVSCTHGTE
jgi:pimeloyl-ACP methyl ester carboxylesterase